MISCGSLCRLHQQSSIHCHFGKWETRFPQWTVRQKRKLSHRQISKKKNNKKRQRGEKRSGNGGGGGNCNAITSSRQREKVAGKTWKTGKLQTGDDRQRWRVMVAGPPPPLPLSLPLPAATTISPFPIAASACCNFSHDYVALTFGLRNHSAAHAAMQWKLQIIWMQHPPPASPLVPPGAPPLSPPQNVCCANGVRQENELWKTAAVEKQGKQHRNLWRGERALGDGDRRR